MARPKESNHGDPPKAGHAGIETIEPDSTVKQNLVVGAAVPLAKATATLDSTSNSSVGLPVAKATATSNSSGGLPLTTATATERNSPTAGLPSLSLQATAAQSPTAGLPSLSLQGTAAQKPPGGLSPFAEMQANQMSLQIQMQQQMMEHMQKQQAAYMQQMEKMSQTMSERMSQTIMPKSGETNKVVTFGSDSDPTTASDETESPDGDINKNNIDPPDSSSENDELYDPKDAHVYHLLITPPPLTNLGAMIPDNKCSAVTMFISAVLQLGLSHIAGALTTMLAEGVNRFFQAQPPQTPLWALNAEIKRVLSKLNFTVFQEKKNKFDVMKHWPHLAGYVVQNPATLQGYAFTECWAFTTHGGRLEPEENPFFNAIPREEAEDLFLQTMEPGKKKDSPKHKIYLLKYSGNSCENLSGTKQDRDDNSGGNVNSSSATQQAASEVNQGGSSRNGSGSGWDTVGNSSWATGSGWGNQNNNNPNNNNNNNNNNRSGTSSWSGVNRRDNNRRGGRGGGGGGNCNQRR